MNIHNFSKIGRYDGKIKTRSLLENTMALLKFISPGESRETSGNTMLQPDMAMSLNELTPGTEGFVFSIGLGSSLKRELEDLGMIPNTLVEVISRDGSDIIIRVGNRRVALDSGTASRIVVHPIHNCDASKLP
jgi:Fe2+ transport system protein FeoA